MTQSEADYEASVRDQFNDSISEVLLAVDMQQDWSPFWNLVGNLKAMTNGGAFSLMQLVAGGAARYDDEHLEEFLAEAEARSGIDSDTAKSYIRTIQIYDRADMRDLGETVLDQLRRMPVQWQKRLPQALTKIDMDPELAQILLGSKTLAEFNAHLRAKTGAKARGKTTWSINSESQILGWDPEGKCMGPVGVVTVSKAAPLYTDLRKQLGIERE